MTELSPSTDCSFLVRHATCSRLRLLATAVIVAVCISLTISEGATASSIVYVKDHNVWLHSTREVTGL
jgi:hypothetical protein